MRSKPVQRITFWFAWRPVWLEDTEQTAWLERVYCVHRHDRICVTYFGTLKAAQDCAALWDRRRVEIGPRIPAMDTTGGIR